VCSIALLLIDEVHLLNENRGACLEGMISRQVGSLGETSRLTGTVQMQDDEARQGAAAAVGGRLARGARGVHALSRPERHHSKLRGHCSMVGAR
jgi:hypothetical protein